MVFSSTVFLFIFLPLVLAGYYLLDRKFRNYFLVLVSLFFYAWGEPKFIFVMIFSIVVNYFFALIINKWHDNKIIVNGIMAIMLVVNIGVLFVFKYSAFVVSNLNRLLNTNMTVPKIALPIGISFFTFQAISYVIDIKRGNGEVQKNPLNVGLYIAFFPQLIAGPIVRYETIAKQIQSRKEDWGKFCEGIERFAIGLSKKVLLSNALAIVADRSFNFVNDDELSVLMAWLGSICYTLQIFYDFSGYSDMAIGLGKMFGFSFKENFNFPYMATSITDFWRRWHISLSSWFRDYVYIPLGGSRCKKSRMLFNLFVVWILTGIWHGASWNFIFWGLFYYLLLVFEKIMKISNKLVSKTYRNCYRIFTLLMINFGWVLFRAENMSSALTYLKKMFGLCDNAWVDVKTIYIFKDNIVLLLVSVLCSVSVGNFIVNRIKTEKGKILFDLCKYFIIIILFMISICSIASSSYNPFIYFNF